MMDTRICNRCGEEKPISEFYVFQTKYNKEYIPRECKECMCERGKIRKDAKFFDFNDTTRVYDEPGKYANDIQKEAVGNILTALGWKLNEKKNIWYNPPLKSKNGKWNFHGIKVVKTENPQMSFAERGKYKKPEPKKPENYKPVQKYSKSLSDEKMEEVRRLSKEEKLTQKQLAEIFSVSQTYIYRIIHYQA